MRCPRRTFDLDWIGFDFIAQCLQANGLVYILHINFNDRCHFFLCHTFPTVLTEKG